MNLYLVQHGEATTEEEDPLRPLSDEGRANVTEVARYVSQNMNIKLRKIFHSEKTRAVQTARILADHLVPSNGIGTADGLLPNNDPQQWADRLKKERGDIMLVGHLPHLKRLAALLVLGDAERQFIRHCNAGILCLTQDESGAWLIDWILNPQMTK